jgi:phage terminase large subunit GpA-like protein
MKEHILTPPDQGSKLLTTSPKTTAKGLVNRILFRVLCCGTFMQQIFVKSYQPQHAQPFPLSQLILQCPACKHRIQLDLVNSHQLSKEALLPYVTYGIELKEDDP